MAKETMHNRPIQPSINPNQKKVFAQRPRTLEDRGFANDEPIQRSRLEKGTPTAGTIRQALFLVFTLGGALKRKRPEKDRDALQSEQ